MLKFSNTEFTKRFFTAWTLDQCLTTSYIGVLYQSLTANGQDDSGSLPMSDKCEILQQ